MLLFLNYRKQISLIVIFGFVVEFLSPAMVFAAPGPAKPEAAQFEPVDATDLVNLFTGDFAYNLPLMEVPGPEGGWPINMSYHSGIGPNTEPTWVGLGWTLNPGAINRFVSGFPDDNYAGFLESKFDAESKGSAVSLGVSYGPVGLSINYDSNRGELGINTSLSLIKAMIGVTPFGFDLKLNTGTSGVGLSSSVGLGGSPIGGKIGLSYSVHPEQKPTHGLATDIETPIASMGISFSNVGSSASFSVTNLSKSSGGSSGPNGKGRITSSGLSLPIPTPVPNLFFNIGYSEWTWRLKEIHREHNFGMINQAGFIGRSPNEIWNPENERSDGKPSNSIASYNAYYRSVTRVPGLSVPVSEGINTITNNQEYKAQGYELTENRKFERNEINKFLFSAEDIYSVSAQGLSGTFRPHYDYHYFLEDNEKGDGGIYRPGQDFMQNEVVNAGSGIHFRFDNEQAFQYATFPKLFTPEYDDYFENFNSINKRHSKQIIPAIDPQTGALRGFEIADSDGKIYEFFKPVYNYYQYSETKWKRDESKSTSTIKNLTPYATSWLLTAVKGPDYVDMGIEGFSSDDLGFWVHFIYEGQEAIAVWRTPYRNGAYRTVQEGILGETKTYSAGISENVYLKYIETPTHLAEFKIGRRLDSRSAAINEFELPITSWSTSGGTYSVSIPCDKHYLEKLVSSTTAQKIELGLKVIQTHYFGHGGKVTDVLIDKNWDILNFGDGLSDNKWIVNTGEAVPNTSCSDPNHFGCNVSVMFGCKVKPNSEGTITSVEKAHPQYLSGINLYKKVLNNDWSTNYSQTESGSSIEGIQFTYNYELQKGNEASVAPTKGKLTLVGVQKTGFNNLPTAPPISFNYNSNPDWDLEKYTAWNSFTSVGKENYHWESKIISEANKDAEAWNLTGIKTAFGSEVKVTYESDEVGFTMSKHISNYRPNSHFEWTRTLNPENYFIESPHFFNYYDERYFDKNRPIYLVVQRSILDEPDIRVCLKVFVESLDFSQNRIYLVYDEITQKLFSNTTYISSDNYIFVPGPAYIGGARVKQVKIESVSDKKITRYEYGPGVTASLPEDYLYSLIPHPTIPTEIKKDVNEIYMDDFNQLGPSPTVGYKWVSVYDIESEQSQNPVNGKVVQKFYTADEAIVETPTDTNSTTLKFIDKTGLVGKMKATELWGEKLNEEGEGIGEYYLARYDSLVYAYSADLVKDPVHGNSTIDSNQISIFQNGFNTVVSHKPIGVSQQSYYTRRSWKDVDQGMVYRRENVFLLGTQSEAYSYDQEYSNPKVSIIKTYNIGFDAATGGALVTVAYDSEGRKTVSESTPANWIYPEMRDKNMLTQKAQSINYLLPGNYDFNQNRAGAQQYVSSASVTTWKNWNSQAWRQNDQYIWVGKKGQFSSFDQWTTAENEDLSPESHDYYPNINTVNWQRTSNIVSYDRYSHPLETRSVDGQYSSVRYGFNDALVVSAASNSRRTEFITEDFEDKTDWDSYGQVGVYGQPYVRSGEKSLKVDSPSGARYCIENSWHPINGGSRTYRLSGWVYSNNPTAHIYLFMKSAAGQETHTSVMTTEKNKWVFLDKKITLTAGTEQVRFRLDNMGGGAIWFDDLRLVPDDASVVTYTYHPITQKVTSITDQNNISAFFIYDTAGRLIKVLDKDRNIVSSYQYNYGKK